MSDLIDRQAAIDAVHKNYDVILDFTSDGQTISFSIEDILSELPSAQPGWIPVTEKCPEIGQIVLCSLKTRRYYGRIHVCKYRAADKYYDHSYFDWDHNGFPDVVAWMPLPKPWEGEKP